jgi:hypothetical protein
MVGAVSMDSHHDNAERKLEKYNGKWMYKYHVVATISNLEGSRVIYNDRVLAPKWADAREYVWGEIIDSFDGIEVVEMWSKGPRGGPLYSSMSYGTCVGRMIQRGWAPK